MNKNEILVLIPKSLYANAWVLRLMSGTTLMIDAVYAQFVKPKK